MISENNNEDIPIFVLINKVDIKDKFFSRENVLHSVQTEYLNTISKKLLGLKEDNNNELILKSQSSFLNYNEKKTIKCPKCC